MNQPDLLSASSPFRAALREPGVESAGTRRPRMLFLCQTLPFPPDAGVNIRTFNVLRLLSRAFDISALFFYRRRERASRAEVEQSLRQLRAYADAEAFEIPQEHSRIRLVRDHLSSVLAGRPYTAYAYESRAFRSRLEQLLQTGPFDIAHIDSLDLAGYLPALAGIPVVCVHHNVESDLLRRRAAAEGSPLLRWYLSLQADRVERDEREWCGRIPLNIAVSDVDRAIFNERAPSSRFRVVPNGVDTQAFQPQSDPQHGIVFVGGATWYPNRDALDHFCTDILPFLREWGVDSPTRWVGRATDAMIESYRARYDVELTGYVPDVRPYLHQAACYIVPLRVGGGTRLKILDAWAAGKAVVSTSIGCEGLEARDGENILIRDDPREFAEAVQLVLRDEDLRRRLAQGARRTAETVYDWEVIGESMIEEYRRLLEHRSVRPRA